MLYYTEVTTAAKNSTLLQREVRNSPTSMSYMSQAISVTFPFSEAMPGNDKGLKIMKNMYNTKCKKMDIN